MFEKASRLKLRFRMRNGMISVEDLWDLKLEDLDKLAIGLNKELKESAEESFISKKKTGSTVTELKFEIVKHVIDTKLAEDEKRTRRAEIKAKRDQLMSLIQQKELSELESKSVEDLKKELEALEQE